MSNSPVAGRGSWICQRRSRCLQNSRQIFLVLTYVHLATGRLAVLHARPGQLDRVRDEAAEAHRLVKRLDFTDAVLPRPRPPSFGILRGDTDAALAHADKAVRARRARLPPEDRSGRQVPMGQTARALLGRTVGSAPRPRLVGT